MADGETAQQLNKRTSAKSAFTKQAYDLSKRGKRDGLARTAEEEFNKLCSLAKQVSDANEDYGAGLLGDLQAETDRDGQPHQQLQAELEKTQAERACRLSEILTV